MALYNYTISIPKRIMEAGDERVKITVPARSYKQATSRAKKKAIEEGLIYDERDWRWQHRRIEGMTG
jgi:hypothetical protein